MEIRLTPDDRMNSSGISLHDAHFQKIRIEEDRLIFEFDTLYVIDGEEELWKSGSITFEEADLDFCDIMLYRESKNGRIKGKRYSFPAFLKEYPEYEFEVVDEGYYGYKIKWDGYFRGKGRMNQFHITVFHLGDMIINI